MCFLSKENFPAFELSPDLCKRVAACAVIQSPEFALLVWVKGCGVVGCGKYGMVYFLRVVVDVHIISADGVSCVSCHFLHLLSILILYHTL